MIFFIVKIIHLFAGELFIRRLPFLLENLQEMKNGEKAEEFYYGILGEMILGEYTIIDRVNEANSEGSVISAVTEKPEASMLTIEVPDATKKLLDAHQKKLNNLSLLAILFVFSIGFALSCKKDASKQTLIYQSDFSKGYDGWEGGFSDWAPPAENGWDFIFKRSGLPAPLNEDLQSLQIGGTNLSDDLFMFLKRKITGLKPNTNYTIFFELEIASNAATDGVGVGGSPSALTIKAGSSINEPFSVFIPARNLYQMQNIDKGDQTVAGRDVVILGNVGVKAGQKEYALISRSNVTELHYRRTNEKGELWVLVGTDSGFESRSILYYKSIKITLKEV